MHFSAAFIKRPVMTTLLMAAFVISGIYGYFSLPVSELPNVDFPTIEVQAGLPGADAETMASSVAAPLEKQFSLIAGLDSMTSQSSQNQTRITLQFRLDRNIDAAFQDVQAAVSAATRALPRDMPQPPSLRKINPAEGSILLLNVSSKTLPLRVVNQYVEDLLIGKLSSVDGVAEAVIFGQARPAVRVQVDPAALAVRGIGIDEVATAIRNVNVNLATGQFDGRTRSAVIHTEGQLNEASEFRNQILTYRDGAPVRFQDVANVVDDIENNKTFGTWNGQPAVSVAINRQPGANTIQVVDGIKEILPALVAQLPPSIEVEVRMDRSVSIRRALFDVQFTLVVAGLLVVGVIFVFLRTATATFIPSIVLPITIAGTFAGMSMMGYSLNNLSLMALTLCVAFVVDDAIVMLENIMRHVEKGEPPLQAAYVGSKEVSFTIPSMTIALSAVFIPVIFMGGIVGRLLNEFAVTIVIAVVVSGIVSLTLTPMLCARMIKSAAEEHAKRHNWFYRASEAAFDATQRGYESSLKWSLRHRRFIFVIFLASIAATVQMFRIMPQDFLPSEDSNQFFATTEGANGISFAEMRRHQEEAAKIFAAEPNIEGVQSSVQNSNRGNFSIQMIPDRERDMTVDQVIAKLRPAFSQIPGINVIMQNRPPIRIGGFNTRALYQYTMQDINLDELYASSTRLLEALSNNPMFTDVNTDLNLTTPSVNVAIDRDRAASLGITPQQIEVALGSAFGGQRVSPIYTQADQYWVILELLPQYQEDPSALDRLFLATSRSATLTGNVGSLVPLTAVTTISRGTQPLTINHLGQLSAVTLSFNLPEGVALGDAVMEIERVRTELEIPASVVGTFQGTARAFQESQQGMGFLLIGGILVVYIVLGVLYESFIHPLTILSSLPAAAVGALLTLYVVGMMQNGYPIPLTLYAFVGMIMLVGLVKKNAIMMVDFALTRQRRDDVDPQTAILEAAVIRFRPIMMTSMAALFGTLPIALGMGDGAEGRIPLGLAVVGGLLFSQALTLYITPVLYVYLDRLGSRVSRRKEIPAPAE